MPRRWSLSRLLLGAVVLTSLASLGSCRKPDSIILVEVASTLQIQVAQLQVIMSAGLDSESFPVPPTPVPDGIRLPTSFTVELDRSRSMPLQVSITALDASSLTVACGTTVQEHFQIGGQTVVTVFLDSCDGSGNPPPPGDDAGSGAPPLDLDGGQD